MPANPIYTEFQSLATELLSEFGNPGAIKYIPLIGQEDPDFGGARQEGQPIDLVGVVTSIDRRLVDNTNVLTTDQMLIVDSQVQINKPGRIETPLGTYSIIANPPVSPAGQTIVQRVVIRG